MGLQSVITTDQGREFRNKLNSELMKAFGIDHRLTTPYHPQANGLVERYNQTLCNTLAKFAQEDRESWDRNLAAIVYGYNTAVQVSMLHECMHHITYLLCFRSLLNKPHLKLCLVVWPDYLLMLTPRLVI